MDKLYFLYDINGKKEMFDDTEKLMTAISSGKYSKLDIFEGTSTGYNLVEIMKNPTLIENEILCRTKSFKS